MSGTLPLSRASSCLRCLPLTLQTQRLEARRQVPSRCFPVLVPGRAHDRGRTLERPIKDREKRGRTGDVDRRVSSGFTGNFTDRLPCKYGSYDPQESVGGAGLPGGVESLPTSSQVTLYHLRGAHGDVSPSRLPRNP